MTSRPPIPYHFISLLHSLSPIFPHTMDIYPHTNIYTFTSKYVNIGQMQQFEESHELYILLNESR